MDMFNASTQPRGVYTMIINTIAQYSTIATSQSAGSSNTPAAPSLVLIVFILLISLFLRRRLKKGRSL